jgi:hypothetical protein
VQVKKWESFETRFAHTAKLSDPFSALHKWQLISGILYSKTTSTSTSTSTSKTGATSIFGYE